MPFSLSLSAVRTCMFDREESIVAQVIIYNSHSLSRLYKAKTYNQSNLSQKIGHVYMIGGVTLQGV